MSDATIVWAFQPLEELQGRTGLVECDEALAQELITADLAQDPRVGAHHYREIVHAAPARSVPRPQTYTTRVMQAEQAPARKPARKQRRGG